MVDACREEREEVLDLAGEYLALCRRWRGAGRRLSAPEIDRLLELRRALEGVLGDIPPAGVPQTRRKGLRVPVLLEARFGNGVEFIDGSLIEVAEEGLFISTPEPAASGSLVCVELPDCGEKLEGTVVRVRGAGDPSGPPGMALHLAHLTPAQCALMLDLVEGALTVRLGAEEE